MPGVSGLQLQSVVQGRPKVLQGENVGRMVAVCDRIRPEILVFEKFSVTQDYPFGKCFAFVPLL